MVFRKIKEKIKERENIKEIFSFPAKNNPRTFGGFQRLCYISFFLTFLFLMLGCCFSFFVKLCRNKDPFPNSLCFYTKQGSL